ncbi:putative transposase [Rubricella aquisinus]|uniref:Putative transposase n=1 Tax=Rubricella aquisinus TaxID=2028108 RepID=A0A840X4F4_9RHOB|nr:IS200/IS605 family transposase [Rubricella aquisinus]MBB5516686.1 putative transposase [Rubricella aquisinus]
MTAYDFEAHGVYHHRYHVVWSTKYRYKVLEGAIRVRARDVMRRIKRRSSRRLQQEFPALKKRYWGKHFWARGYFCTTSGNVTNDLILQYLAAHSPDATDVSR